MSKPPKIASSDSTLGSNSTLEFYTRFDVHAHGLNVFQSEAFLLIDRLTCKAQTVEEHDFVRKHLLEQDKGTMFRRGSQILRYVRRTHSRSSRRGDETSYLLPSTFETI
ncbi:hypothetical protein L3Y34_013094 [Caenorhabditis briggsae]|uniref:Uncharacterized protein n=1 Tax=Caenorhabditis briggsae TaxID=6238 RepID=A0AAE8ZW20_CAEBR|nr:hypothetical protein L3Y34_013094 [Caenorhabditis briggsae]